MLAATGKSNNSPMLIGGRGLLNWVLIVLALLTFGAEARADALGPRFPVNTYKTHNQTRSSIAALTGGGFVVTWQSMFEDGSYWGIYAQRYNALGQRVGGEFRVNSEWRLYQFGPSVAGLTDGGFVVTWYSRNSYGRGSGVFGQRFDNAGRRVGGEFLIENDITPGTHLDTSVASLPNGGFVVAYTTRGPRPERHLIAVRRFSAGLPQPVGPRIEVSTATQDVNDYSNPRVTGLADGSFVVIYITEWTATVGLFARRYNASGVLVGAFKVAQTASALPLVAYPALVGLKDGGFVIVWIDENMIFGQRYYRTSARAGATFPISTMATIMRPSVSSLADGGFVVLYRSDNSDFPFSIFGHRYNWLGVPVGAEFVVAPPYTISQFGPAVAGLANGGFVTSWSDYDAHDLFDDVFARRYGP
jgi:hypothetical protein